MSGRPPHLDATALEQALGSRLPARLTREGRVRMLGAAAEALLAGRMPTPEQAAFLGGGIKAWLNEGGDLTREYWKVSAPAGSHRTPSYIWNSSSRGGNNAEESGIVSRTNTEIPYDDISTESK